MRAEIPFVADIVLKHCEVHGMCSPPSAKKYTTLQTHVVFACLGAGEPYAMALAYGAACI